MSERTNLVIVQDSMQDLRNSTADLITDIQGRIESTVGNLDKERLQDLQASSAEIITGIHGSIE